jgi:hypothetical protein
VSSERREQPPLTPLEWVLGVLSYLLAIGGMALSLWGHGALSYVGVGLLALSIADTAILLILRKNRRRDAPAR